MFSKNRGAGFCFSEGIREEYFFSKVFSLGMELEYLRTNSTFAASRDVSLFPEMYSVFIHTISVDSWNIPLFCRLRTKKEPAKGISFFAGAGLSWIMNAHRDINMVSGYMGSQQKDVVPIASGAVKIKNENNNRLGTMGLLGIGKNFAIKNKVFFCEAKYKFDLNRWVYPTVADPVNSSFHIKRQCVFLSLGFTF